MKKILLMIGLLPTSCVYAQELFVFTEPASNMPSKSIGIRLDNIFMKEKAEDATLYNFKPEVMVAMSKHIMVHVAGYFNNAEDKFTAKGASIYLKYRLLSIDDIHDHFRLATFGEFAFNNGMIMDKAIMLGRNNSGYEAGVVATKLINKIAFSISSSFAHAMDNGKEGFLYGHGARNAVNYTLSIGKLMLPKEYTSYKQTNVNLMLELLGQTNLESGYPYIDMAASIQFIFNSQARVDLSYRFALANKLERTSDNSALLRFEYNFFNVIK